MRGIHRVGNPFRQSVRVPSNEFAGRWVLIPLFSDWTVIVMVELGNE